MTTSATQDFLSEIIGGGPIPGGKLTYFQARLSGRIHQAMLNAFGRLEREKNFTRRDLARRIGRKPEQITRWFSYPGNLTLDTVSDIFLGMGYELEAIILMNLATGAKIRFPEQSHTGQHSTAASAESQVVYMGLYREQRQEEKPSELELVASPPARGMAESDQLNTRWPPSPLRDIA